MLINESHFTQKWSIVNLDEVVEFLDSQRKPITEKDRISGTYPYYGANGQQDLINDYIFDEPLVLLAEDGGHFGEPNRTIAYQINGKCWVNNHAHVLRPKNNINIRYLCRVLEHYDVSKYITGSTRAKLTKTSASQIKIPLPPIASQRRIANILDKADEIIRKRKEAIALTEQLQKSIFLDMFGDPVINPKGWEKVTLGNLLAEELQNGAYFEKNYYTNDLTGVEMIHMSDAFYGTVTRGNLKRVLVSDAEVKKYQLNSDDILIARRSLNYEGAAKPCLIEDCCNPLIFESSLIRVRVKKNIINPIYLFSYMMQPRAREKYIYPYVTRSTISGINQAGLKKITIVVPPIALQNRFKEICDQIKKKSLKLELHLQESENLFNSLLQKAFKGEL